MTTAKILADSINDAAIRLTTFEIVVPKYMVAQLNTHRAISRNYESSRAKPFWRVLEQVVHDPYIPKRFGKPSRGMQPAGYWEGFEYAEAVESWLEARDLAVQGAMGLAYGSGFTSDGFEVDYAKEHPPLVAKELLNRILEPYMKVKGIISATDWGNFIDLRTDPSAQDDINSLAKDIKLLLGVSNPHFINDGDWHLPDLGGDRIEVVENIARVSYGNHRSPSTRPEGTLYKELRDGGHWSPFEHVAWASGGSSGKSNFDPSWVQLRQVLGGK